MRKRISPEEMCIILRKIRSEIPYCKIAAQHNLFPASITRIANRNGIKFGIPRLERRLERNLGQIKSDLSKGVCLKDIASEMEVSPSTLRRFLQKCGVLAKSKPGRKTVVEWPDEVNSLLLARLTRDYFHRPLNALRAA